MLDFSQREKVRKIKFSQKRGCGAEGVTADGEKKAWEKTLILLPIEKSSFGSKGASKPRPKNNE